MTIENLLTRYDARVPRYTSYPTAPHFSDSVGDAEYGTWLAALNRQDPVSIYVHVPFCEALCLYCGCNTQVVRQKAPIAAYADLLLAEIDLVAKIMGPGFRIGAIHFGGGTPSSLGNGLVKVVESLARNFTIGSDAEIAIEVDPRVLRAADYALLRELGLNRASIGVQDFDPQVQAAINRRQSYAETAVARESLRAMGVQSINVDLMYGLPHQTVESVARTADLALRLAPERFSVFGYAHVPWMKRHQALLPEAALPSPVQRYEQRQAAEGCITGQGYIAIGLDHFARPDDDLARAAADRRLHRNFQGYTTDAAPVLLGFGASSIGSLPQGYVQNFTSIPEYRARIAAGRLATARGVGLTAADRERRCIIETIMCDFAIDLADHDSSDDFATERQDLQALVRDGLIRLDGQRIGVTEQGRPFVRAVAAVFDTYLRSGKGRHSAAV